MATAFALALAYFSENSHGTMTATAIAAYVRGNVASNLFGRLMSASIADTFGLQTNFVVFALLNLAGCCLAYGMLKAKSKPVGTIGTVRFRRAVPELIRVPALRAAFAIGVCILFVFIGIFTYVNFVLVQAPLSLGMMAVGFVYFVFLPAVITTPMAGRMAAWFGIRQTLCGSLAIALAGMPLLLAQTLPIVLLGLSLVGIGTFLAQALTAAFVGRAAATDAAAASGLYLASYYLGGLVGSIALGQAFVPSTIRNPAAATFICISRFQPNVSSRMSSPASTSRRIARNGDISLNRAP